MHTCAIVLLGEKAQYFPAAGCMSLSIFVFFSLINKIYNIILYFSPQYMGLNKFLEECKTAELKIWGKY